MLPRNVPAISTLPCGETATSTSPLYIPPFPSAVSPTRRVQRSSPLALHFETIAEVRVPENPDCRVAEGLPAATLTDPMK